MHHQPRNAIGKCTNSGKRTNRAAAASHLGKLTRILVERRAALQYFHCYWTPQARGEDGIDDSRLSIHHLLSHFNSQRCTMPVPTSFEKIETEKLNPQISRQMLSGADATLARIFLARGAIVPRHSHRSEQFSWIISGALKFYFDDGETIVRAGEMILIPAHAPHKAEALEDTVDIDFFAPRREDWITKNDAYLRGDAQAQKD
jgi:quercetin dioxygenase-like cupin family protein